jgi:GNAT superfamily N-acetyltransferase
LRETFVATFAVDAAYRRHGYGRALQTAALKMTRALGCYQMRS